MIFMYIRSCDCVTCKIISSISCIITSTLIILYRFYFWLLMKQQGLPLSNEPFGKLLFLFGTLQTEQWYHRSWSWATGLQLWVLRCSEVKNTLAGSPVVPLPPRRCSLRHVCAVSAAAVHQKTHNLWSSQRVQVLHRWSSRTSISRHCAAMETQLVISEPVCLFSQQTHLCH